MAADQTVYNV